MSHIFAKSKEKSKQILPSPRTEAKTKQFCSMEDHTDHLPARPEAPDKINKIWRLPARPEAPDTATTYRRIVRLGVPAEARGKYAVLSFLDMENVKNPIEQVFSKKMKRENPLEGGRCRRPGLPSGVAESVFCCKLASAKGIVPRARARTSPEPEQEQVYDER